MGSQWSNNKIYIKYKIYEKKRCVFWETMCPSKFMEAYVCL